MATSAPRFLSVDDVCAIQQDTLTHEGGLGGVKNAGLLEAAVAMPRQQYRGAYLHDGIPAMAAAYFFHLCMNHPFNDGNKRAAVVSALAFARLNGHRVALNERQLEKLTLDVASGALDKADLAAVFDRAVVPAG